MTADKLKLFDKSLEHASPQQDLSPYLKALWYDAKNNWAASHNIIQEIDDKNAAWVHAYLHRKEGDLFNADYWYTKAGKVRPQTTLQEEWQTLVNYFLQ